MARITAMDKRKVKTRTKTSFLVDQTLKLVATLFFAVTLLIPGVYGWLEGEVNTADIMYESFIFAKDKLVGPVAVMVALARILIALSIPMGVYRNDVSDLFGLELYGPRTLARLLFIVGAILYMIGGFIAWKNLTGGF